MADTKTFEEIGQEIESLQASAGEMLERLGATSSMDDIKSVKTELGETQTKLAELISERDARLRLEEMNGVKAQVTNLEQAIKDMQESSRVAANGMGRQLGNAALLGDDRKSIYAKGERSFFGDIASARHGDRKAVERLEEAYQKGEGKAMSELAGSGGGFLVRPYIVPGELPLIERLPILQQIVPKVRVNTDSIEFISVTGGLTAGWVAELAAKPQGDMTFGTLTVSVFTAAGLAVTSNQLLADSSIDQLIQSDLVKRVGNVIEKAIINGSGTGQPLGILGTPGVNAVTYTDASPTVVKLLNQILNGITAVQENHLREPTHIVMRPHTWTSIVSDPSTSPGVYTLGTDMISRARTASDPLPARTLFGYPVLLSGNMPTNLGAGTNESRVIVGDFSEALLLEREDFKVDQSEHVYFTSNQTVFRGEQRLGFTAAKYPNAFSVVAGTGMIGA